MRTGGCVFAGLALPDSVRPESAGKASSPQSSCHDGVVVEWVGKAGRGDLDAEARRKKSPSFARMHKAEPYATGHLAESTSCEWVSGENAEQAQGPCHDGAVVELGWETWRAGRVGRLKPAPPREVTGGRADSSLAL
jgi:hypothetical protein